jgi:GntR family transcriptional regulator
MDIIISNTSGKPIYEQITSQIKAMILNGTLQEGEACRPCAIGERTPDQCNHHKRAYEDLERDGFIETVTGRGALLREKIWSSSGRNICV